MFLQLLLLQAFRLFMFVLSVDLHADRIAVNFLGRRPVHEEALVSLGTGESKGKVDRAGRNQALDWGRGGGGLLNRVVVRQEERALARTTLLSGRRTLSASIYTRRFPP